MIKFILATKIYPTKLEIITKHWKKKFQIKETIKQLCKLVNHQVNVYTKALFVLILISYIETFVDGNKRNARIISNAILINNNYCPILFRTVDLKDYKKAMLIFTSKITLVHLIKFL